MLAVWKSGRGPGIIYHLSDVGVEKGREDLIERRRIVEVPMYVVTLTGGVQCACAHPCTVPSISGSRDTLMGGGVQFPSMYCPGMVRVSGISGYSDRGCSVLVAIHLLSWNGDNISGSQYTLTGGGAVPIHVLSQDGQSIMSPQGGMVWFVHPGAILGRSEYFGSYGQVW